MSEETLNAAIAAKWESAGLLDESGAGDVDMDTGGDEETAPDADGAEADADAADADDTVVDETSGDSDVAEVDATDETETTESTETATEEKPAAEAVAEQVKDAEDDLALALGLGKPPADPKKRAAWWKQRLPYSQIHKAVSEREKKLNETHTGALKQHTDRISEYDTRFSDVKKVEDIISNSPEQYMRTLASIFPDTYGKMFAPLLGDGKDAAAALLVAEADPGPQPEPDYDLPDGKKTYSLDGYAKLMAWQQKVTEQSMLKRFKPHMDFVQSQQKEAEKQQKIQLAEQTKQKGLQIATNAIAEVEKWDLGKENLQAIVDAAAKLDPSIDARLALHMAYREVVGPLLKADRDKMQAQILKDMKKKSAKQTSAALTQARTNVPAVVDGAKTDVDSRIKAAWKRAGLIP